MSTPEQPATPAITRKQLRDIRNTGATPIVSPDAQPEPEDHAASADAPSEQPAAPVVPDVPVAAPLPRAAVPITVHDVPGTDASVDLGVAPLTRRQARQQERIRTASVPVITPDVAAAHVAHDVDSVTSDATDAPDVADSDLAPAVDDVAAPEVPREPAHTDVPESEPDGEQFGLDDIVDQIAADTHEPNDAHEAIDAHSDDEAHTEDESSAEDELTADGEDRAGSDDAASARALINPQFGAELLAGEPIDAALPSSFDQLISRSVTGSIGTGNALILSQTPSAPPMSAPVTATGEVLITGTFNLPEGLGSTGHAPGTADGKEVDAVLIDGELPAHSSPTPIAASAAISTVKNGGDIIKPPTPEKGGRLMLTLAITAGVLALALVGVLILAFVTGVFR
jgi:hypothetical protein